MTGAEFAEYTTYYYRSGSPGRAAEALSHLISSEAFARAAPEQMLPLLHLFTLVSKQDPAVVRAYEAALKAAPPSGRIFILQLLQWAGDVGTLSFLKGLLADGGFRDEHDTIRKLLKDGLVPEEKRAIRTIHTGADLDQLWVEFTVSGERGPVERIAGVLSWPDRLRGKIEEWLRARPLLGFLSGRGRKRQGLGAALSRIAGTDVAIAGDEVRTVDDLDCLFLLEDLRVHAERVPVLLRALPFGLSADDLMYMSTKATARWSLASNAGQHPLVLEVCRDLAARESGSARLGLLEVVAAAHLSSASARGEWAQAEEALRAYLALSPARADLQGKLVRAANRRRQSQLHELPRISAAEGPGPEDPIGVARSCAAATAAQRSYFTSAELRDFRRQDRKEHDHLAGSWQLEIAGPDRYHGQQVFWQEERPDEGLADEWITIGEEHYERPAFWVRWPRPQRAELNRFLRADGYLELLRTGTPEAATVHMQQGARYLRLGYTTNCPAGFPLLPEGMPCQMDLWIDLGAELLSLAEVRVKGARPDGGEADFLLTQTFSGHGGELKIAAPEAMLSLPADVRFQ